MLLAISTDTKEMRKGMTDATQKNDRTDHDTETACDNVDIHTAHTLHSVELHSNIVYNVKYTEGGSSDNVKYLTAMMLGHKLTKYITFNIR